MPFQIRPSTRCLKMIGENLTCLAGDHKVSPEVSWLDSVPQDEYRSQVVDVLANTMNNCLAELGYHPDFTQQLQTIHEWNIRLRNENAKLFQDNKKLAQLIGMQNERISKTVPNIPLNQGVADLQIRLQAVELNRQELLTQHHAAYVFRNAPCFASNLIRSQISCSLEEIGFLRQEVARLNRMLRVRLTSTSGSSQVPVQTQVPPQTHIPVHTHISQTGFLPMYDGELCHVSHCGQRNAGIIRQSSGASWLLLLSESASPWFTT